MDITPIKDMKPQLVCIGRILGMDLYIDMLHQDEKKYELAQELLKQAFYPPKED